MTPLRTDLALLSEWIQQDSRVLDLGCGDGTLLAYLRDNLNVRGYGLEINDEYLVQCIKSGINVIHTDLNKGLSDFNDNSFDFVVMTQTLQAIQRPDLLLLEMLRVGRQGIVTFPNIGHWQCRWQIMLNGKMPVSRALPDSWYNTENIHLCTLYDFETLCSELEIEIIQRAVVDSNHRSSLLMRWLPNLLGEVALYRFQKKV